jgi:hypothetical protein
MLDPLAPADESAGRLPLASSSFLLYTPHAKLVAQNRRVSLGIIPNAPRVERLQ